MLWRSPSSPVGRTAWRNSHGEEQKPLALSISWGSSQLPALIYSHMRSFLKQILQLPIELTQLMSWRAKTSLPFTRLQIGKPKKTVLLFYASKLAVVCQRTRTLIWHNFLTYNPPKISQWTGKKPRSSDYLPEPNKPFLTWSLTTSPTSFLSTFNISHYFAGPRGFFMVFNQSNIPPIQGLCYYCLFLWNILSLIMWSLSTIQLKLHLFRKDFADHLSQICSLCTSLFTVPHFIPL